MELILLTTFKELNIIINEYYYLIFLEFIHLFKLNLLLHKNIELLSKLIEGNQCFYFYNF